MQYKNLCLVGLLGLCLIIGQSMAAPGEKVNALNALRDLCDTLPSFEDNIDLGAVENATIVVSDTTYLTFMADNIKLRGLQDLFIDCNLPRINGSVGVSGLEITGYSLTGLIVDNIQVTGTGDASIMMEDFSFLIEDIVNPKLDLWMYQWTVLFNDLMPGSDLGLLFNEFMSELGPEVANAIEDIINGSETGVQTFINKLVAAQKH